ncbi:MAG: hypothetical protein QNJ69_03510 [Gammaproteobacteria bacterium]|nr:hypothetical protein [Gammaproteobacteria bacterium]
METGTGKFDTQADAAMRTAVAVDIATRIILGRISGWYSLANKPEVATGDPDSEPLVTAGSGLAVSAITENLVDRLAGELKPNLATLAITFSHLVLQLFDLLL